MTALADLLSTRDRARLLERLAELKGVDRMMRRPGAWPSRRAGAAAPRGPRRSHREDNDVVTTLIPAEAPAIEHADALDWLAAREPGAATAVIFDPPYAVGSPVRGREDGAAGSVSGPLSFMQRTMSLCARALRPGGIVIIFGDYKRLPDLMYAATTSGLRLSGCVAWVRTRPGTGGLFRSSWDPVLIASSGTPDAVDRAAVRNVVETATTWSTPTTRQAHAPV